MTILRRRRKAAFASRSPGIRSPLKLLSSSIQCMKKMGFKKDAITIRIESAQKTESSRKSCERKREEPFASFAKTTSLCITHANKKRLLKPRKGTQNTKKSYPFLRSKKVTLNPAVKVVLSLKTNEEPKVRQRMGIDVILVGKIQRILFVFVRYLILHAATQITMIHFSTPTLCDPCHLSLPCIQHRSSPKFLLTSPLTSLSSAQIP